MMKIAHHHKGAPYRLTLKIHNEKKKRIILKNY